MIPRYVHVTRGNVPISPSNMREAAERYGRSFVLVIDKPPPRDAAYSSLRQRALRVPTFFPIYAE
jgi:hypothetical protein